MFGRTSERVNVLGLSPLSVLYMGHCDGLVSTTVTGRSSRWINILESVTRVVCHFGSVVEMDWSLDSLVGSVDLSGCRSRRVVLVIVDRLGLSVRYEVLLLTRDGLWTFPTFSTDRGVYTSLSLHSGFLILFSPFTLWCFSLFVSGLLPRISF